MAPFYCEQRRARCGSANGEMALRQRRHECISFQLYCRDHRRCNRNPWAFAISCLSSPTRRLMFCSYWQPPGRVLCCLHQ